MTYFKDLGTAFPYMIDADNSFTPVDLDGDGRMEIASYGPFAHSLNILSYAEGQVASSAPQLVNAWACTQTVPASSQSGTAWALQAGDSYYRVRLPGAASAGTGPADSLIVFHRGVLGDGQARLGVLQWTGQQMETMFVSQAGSLIQGLGLNANDQFLAADIDGDGWEELVIFSPDDLWLFTLRWTGTTFEVISGQQNSIGPAWQMSYTDIYLAACRLESGADQIVAFDPRSGGTLTTLYLSNGALVSNPITGVIHFFVNPNVFAANLNGRGRTQLVVYGNNGQAGASFSMAYLQWFPQAKGFIETTPNIDLGVLSSLQPAAFVGQDTEYLFAFNNQNPSTVSVFSALKSLWSSTGSVPGAGINPNDVFYVADVDGDGCDELVMFSPNDRWLFTIKWDGSQLTAITQAQYHLGPAPVVSGVQFVNQYQSDTLVALFNEYEEAGGGGDAACGPDQSGQQMNGSSIDISNRWAVYVVGFREVLLQETMHGCFLNWNGANLATDDGNGNYFYNQGQALPMTVTDLGGGNVSFNAGGSIAANYSASAYLDPTNGNFDYYPVQNAGSASTSASEFQFGGSQLPVLVICHSATGCNLQGADLSDGGNLPSLACCNLSGAHLEGASFAGLTGKSLVGTNFNGAFLNGAKLDGMNVTQAIWTQATLSSTDLSVIDPDAQNTDFSSAILKGATLSTPNSPIDFTGSKFLQAHLEGAHLEGAILRGCNFTGAHLYGAHLDGADLTGAILTGADLTLAHLTGTILTNVTLYGTTLVGVDLTTATVDQPAKFSHDPDNVVHLENSTIPFDMLGLDWSYLVMTGATIDDIPDKLDGLNADYAVFPDQLDLRSRSIRNATFDHALMPDVQFGPRMSGPFRGADLENAVMTNASMPGGRLQKANLQGADLTNANLEASLIRLTDGKPSVAVLDGAFLINATLDYVQANGSSLQGALFITYAPLGGAKATAYYAQMNNAKLDGAVLYAADFSNAQLAGASISSKASLVNATFASVNLGPAQSGEQANASLREADIRGTQFGVNGRLGPTAPANMDGCDLSLAQYSTESGPYAMQFTDYHGNRWSVDDIYGPTLLGTTNAQTICPDEANGPCHLTQAFARRVA